MIRGTYRILVVLLGVIIIAGLVACTSDRTVTPTPAPSTATAPGWMEIDLTDVATGGTFRVSDFKKKTNPAGELCGMVSHLPGPAERDEEGQANRG